MGKKVEFVHSSRGGMVVCIDDYMFKKYTKKADGTGYYYCVSKRSSKCPASVQVRDEIVNMETLKEGHKHPNHKSEIDKFKFIWNIRKRASEDPLSTVLNIYREEIQKMEATHGPEFTARMPTYNSLETTLYRDRNAGFIGFPREMRVAAAKGTDAADSEKWPNAGELDSFVSKPDDDGSEHGGDRAEDNMQYDDHSNAEMQMSEEMSEDSRSQEEESAEGQKCYNCTSICPPYNLTKLSHPLKIKWEASSGSNGHSSLRSGVNFSYEDSVTVQEALQRVYNVRINPTEPEAAFCSYCVRLLASIYKPFREFRNLSIQSNSEMATDMGILVKREAEDATNFEGWGTGEADFSFENDYDDPLSEEDTSEPQGPSRNLLKRDRSWQESSKAIHKRQRTINSDQNMTNRNKQWKCVYCLKRFSRDFILFYHNKEEHPDEDDEGGLHPNLAEPRRTSKHSHSRQDKPKSNPRIVAEFMERHEMPSSPEAEAEPDSPSNYEYHLEEIYSDNQSAASTLKAEDIWQRKSSVPSAEGLRVYYDCKFKQCPAKLYLLWENESRTIKFYRTSTSHNHEFQEKGLPAATKAMIGQVYKEGVTKQNIMMKILRERGFPEPKMSHVGHYLRKLRAGEEVGSIHVRVNGDNEISAFVPIPGEYSSGSNSNIFL